MLDGALDMGRLGLAALKGVVGVVQYDLSMPDDEKCDAKQAADQHVAPECFEAQPQRVHQQIAAEQRTVFVVARQPEIPASEGLKRDHAGVDGDDGRQPEAKEGKEVD